MDFAESIPKLERIPSILLVLGVLHLCSASPVNTERCSSILPTTREENGNPAAAADLYGIGIRIGIYMQTIGMLMSLVSAEQPNFKFAAATNTLAVLLSWTILAQRKSFSACEAWLILSIIGTFVFPGGAALCNMDDVTGEGVGIVAIWVSILWLFSSIIWLFASLLYRLPVLGTSNAVWIFVRVRIDGWFRVLMLVVDCVLLVTSFLAALMSIILIRKATRAWYACKAEAKIPLTKEEKEALKKEQKEQKERKEALESFRYSQCIVGLIIWVLAIISCEKIIQWNGLSPENDLSRPGQAIPLTVGILILLDGVLNLLKQPARFTHRDTWTNLLEQVTSGSLTNIRRTPYILLSLWKEWRRR